ncbi:MAG: ECF-type sigma factor [Isosphaeraceae bacterium]
MKTETVRDRKSGGRSEPLTSVHHEGEARVSAVFEEYLARLVRFARVRLGGEDRRPDAEDAVMSAFRVYCGGVRDGRFVEHSKDETWSLLAKLVKGKLRDHGRKAANGKHGGGRVRSLEALGESGDMLAERRVDAEDGLALLELLLCLPDESHRRVASWRLEGFQIAEIAERLDCSERTVKRKLELIREFWTRHLA